MKPPVCQEVWNPGLIKTNIRANFLGEGTLKSRFMEWMIGLLTPSAETYAERLTPLLVSPDLEAHSGAMFDRKGFAILPSPKLMDASYVNAFIAVSEALGISRECSRLLMTLTRAGARTAASVRPSSVPSRGAHRHDFIAGERGGRELLALRP